MQIRMSGGSAVINGKSYQGNSITIRNGQVVVDGILQQGDLTGEVHVTVHGNVEYLESHAGSVIAENVTGNISTGSGDVRCGNIGGSVSTGSGDVACGHVAGNVKTGSGDIRHR